MTHQEALDDSEVALFCLLEGVLHVSEVAPNLFCLSPHCCGNSHPLLPALFWLWGDLKMG